MDEPSKGDGSVIEDVLLVWSKELTLVGSYLEEDPFELCGDYVMGNAALSIEHIDSIYTEPPNLTLILSPLLPTIPLSFECIL